MQELSMNLLDVAENSVAAGAKLVHIELAVDEKARRLRLVITDDGKGMDPELAKRVTDPFCTSRTSRKVGLGLPFLKMAAELTGGQLTLESEEGKGTAVTALFCTDHIDMPPLGDVAASVARVRPWKLFFSVTILARPSPYFSAEYFRAALNAHSFASAPEFAKNARFAPVLVHKSSASLLCGSA